MIRRAVEFKAVPSSVIAHRFLTFLPRKTTA